MKHFVLHHPWVSLAVSLELSILFGIIFMMVLLSL